MDADAVQQLEDERLRREAATEGFVERVRQDRHIIACFIYGSTVRGDYWFNSDIDVILITTDESTGIEVRVLEEGGCWFQAFLLSRRRFRQICEGAVSSVGPSSMRHNGRLLYCEDSSLREYFEEDGRLGTYEMSCKVFVAGAWCHFYFQKIEKYHGRRQRERAYNTLNCLINHFAAVIILLKGRATEKELIEQAMEIAPEHFAPYPPVIYGPIPGLEEIAQVTERIKDHIRDHLGDIFRLLIDFMKDEGRELPISTIHDRFAKVLQAKENELMYGACEMLCEVRLTKKSTTAFVEPAYAYMDDGRST